MIGSTYKTNVKEKKEGECRELHALSTRPISVLAKVSRIMFSYINTAIRREGYRRDYSKGLHIETQHVHDGTDIEPSHKTNTKKKEKRK